MRLERRCQLADQDVAGEGPAVTVEAPQPALRRPASSALFLNRITSDSASALAVTARGLILGGLKLRLGNLELLPGQGHGDLLVLFGPGRLLDHALLGLDQLLLLLGENLLDPRLRFGLLLHLFLVGIGPTACLATSRSRTRLSDLLGRLDRGDGHGEDLDPCFLQFSVRLWTRSL